MNKLPLFAICLLFGHFSVAQTCTVTGSSPLNWPTDGSGIVCGEGGNAVGKTTLVIPVGFTVNFNDNTDTWTGTEIEVYGTLTNTANVTLNSSIRVKPGGLLHVDGQLSLGTAAGCGYYIAVGPGGTVTVAGTGSDRLSVCGNIMMQGSGVCNNCSGTNSGQCAYTGVPYCQPGGGFTGPSGYGETGYDPSLPVTLLYFNAEAFEEIISLTWATTMEEDFSRFQIQRSGDGINFEDIGEVKGKGFDIYEIESKYSFEDQVPLSGFNYYRLKAIDLDESFEYFPVRAVKLKGVKKIAVYPNPSSGEVISFRTNFSPSESDRIILTDQLGVEIFGGEASSTGNRIVPENKLQAGIYLLRYVSEGSEHTARVVVKNQ
jgi:hypothetical protein